MEFIDAGEKLWLDVLWNLQVTLLSHERQEIVEIEVQVS
jgi:hypothetical protein